MDIDVRFINYNMYSIQFITIWTEFSVHNFTQSNWIYDIIMFAKTK